MRIVTTSVARSPWQNGVVERRNHTLIEVARTILIYAKALLFLWAKAVATACYTQNRSIIHLRHGKTPYEILHDKPPDLSFFHVFGALCYPTNDSENLVQDSANPHPQTVCTTLRTDGDILFQRMFVKYSLPSTSGDLPALKYCSIDESTFADADHAGCQDTRRSTSGSIQLLGDRLHVENGVIELYFVNMEYQLTDIFTKALGRERIEFLINKLGMRSFTPETLKKLTDDVDE
ncbi:retrovirus-related pol polyprotein from transposon TNT 1-94 [Tanacetum coccineum]